VPRIEALICSAVVSGPQWSVSALMIGSRFAVLERVEVAVHAVEGG
jgi:hypothetical protein